MLGSMTVSDLASCMLVTHLSCFVIDLQSQLSGGSQDKGDWVLLAAAIPSILLRMKEIIFIRTSQTVM